MPTYEYRCEKGHTFERVQKMNDRPVGKCPVCGAKASRVISGGQGLIFKGTGFYITDYGKDGKGPRKDSEGGAVSESKGDAGHNATADSNAPANGESKSEPKSQSKPDQPLASTADAKQPSRTPSARKSGKPDAP